MIYFAYDIVMDEGELHRHAPGAVVAGTGWLLNRRLVFAGEGGKHPLAVPSYGDRVYGVLSFASEPGDEAALLALRAPIPMRITRVRTIPLNRIVFAVTFEAESGMAVPKGPADPFYRDRMVEIARRMEFPSEYIDILASIPTPDETIRSDRGGEHR
jgi:hypothetical protein